MKTNDIKADIAKRTREHAVSCADSWLRAAGVKTYTELLEELRRTRKHLREANRGAERAALVCRLQAARLDKVVDGRVRLRVSPKALEGPKP